MSDVPDYVVLLTATNSAIGAAVVIPSVPATVRSVWVLLASATPADDTLTKVLLCATDNELPFWRYGVAGGAPEKPQVYRFQMPPPQSVYGGFPGILGTNDLELGFSGVITAGQLTVIGDSTPISPTEGQATAGPSGQLVPTGPSLSTGEVACATTGTTVLAAPATGANYIYDIFFANVAHTSGFGLAYKTSVSAANDIGFASSVSDGANGRGVIHLGGLRLTTALICAGLSTNDPFVCNYAPGP